MNSRLVVIMAHAGIEATFERHLPLWMAHGSPLLVFAPSDSIPKIPDRIPILSYGHAEHHGVHSIERFKCLLNFLGRMDYDSFLIFEYDSFLLDPACTKTMFHENDGFYGGVFFIGEDDAAFKGQFYCHPPFAITRGVLNVLNNLNLAEDEERGFYDRWLGYALELTGLKLGSYVADCSGFSRNTIEPEDRRAAVNAIEDGAVWVHGCKDALCHQMLVHAYQKRKALIEAQERL